MNSRWKHYKNPLLSPTYRHPKWTVAITEQGKKDANGNYCYIYWKGMKCNRCGAIQHVSASDFDVFSFGVNFSERHRKCRNKENK